MRFVEHVAIVTGAASGIGRAISELLAQQGARVLAVDIDEARLMALAERGVSTKGAISTMVGGPRTRLA